MTGTLTANAVEVLRDVAGNVGAHLFLSSLIYGGRNMRQQRIPPGVL